MACRTAIVVLGFLAANLEPTEGLLAGLRGTPSAPAKHDFKQDCALKGKGSLVEIKRVRQPGSGTDQSKITPYAEAFKDGFQSVDCVKDYLFTHGDMFGNNKLSYKREQVSNVSIVHYTEHVASMDRKAMTHEVCFEFCRTIKNMSFFSLHNGRDCYCAPFFQAEASDSSMCDAPCDGNPATQCGGKSKSSVFAMHDCQVDNEQVLKEMQGLWETRKQIFDTERNYASDLFGVMTASANKCHQTFSTDGNPGAAGLCQQAKVQASEIMKAVEKAENTCKAVDDLFEGVAAEDTSQTDHERVLFVEAERQKADELMKAAKETHDVFVELLEASTTPFDGDKLQGAKDQYFPAMYFVDKAFAKASSTCTGVTVGRALFNATKDRCARACDAAVTDCVGYQFFGGEDAGNTDTPEGEDAGNTDTSGGDEGIKENGKCLTEEDSQAGKAEQQCCGELKCVIQKNKKKLEKKCIVQDADSEGLKWGRTCNETRSDECCCGMECFSENHNPKCRLKATSPCSKSVSLVATRVITEAREMPGLCFLMSKFETVTYYNAECVHPTRCYAKLSRFEGTTLKPDPTGKCGRCLKEAVHADRCFE